MDHILVISDTAQSCQKVASQLPHAGCSWDSYQFPHDRVKFRLWHTRYRVAARAIRKGYNVLIIDSDTVLFYAPYPFFKSPPFNTFQVINQPECLWDQTCYSSVVYPNGGLIYFQNAAPNGPTAYMVAETTDRVLRNVDDGWQMMKSRGFSDTCNVMDQEGLCDALWSVSFERPLFARTAEACWEQPGNRTHQQHVRQQSKAKMELAWTYEPAVPLTGLARNIAGNASTPLSAPMWPDPEDPDMAPVATQIPQERYLFAPPWLMFGFFPRGSDGVWTPDALGIIHQVIGHAHYMEFTDKVISKTAARQLVRQFDWDLATKSRAMGVGPFFAGRGRPGQQHETNPEAPRLLVLHSHVKFEYVKSFTELFAILEGLVQLAQLSNRALVWPELPCNHSLVGQYNRSTNSIHHRRKGTWFPWGNRNNADGSGLSCLLSRLLRSECLSSHRGLLGPEWEHYRHTYNSKFLIVARQHDNMAFKPAPDQRNGVLSISSGQGPAAVLVQVNQSQAQAHLDVFRDDRVLYLAHPVQVSDYKADKYSSCLTDDIKQALSFRIREERAGGSRIVVHNGTVSPEGHIRVHGDAYNGQQGTINNSIEVHNKPIIVHDLMAAGFVSVARQARRT